MGSWKIIPMWLPRTWRISLSPISSRFLPSKMTSPCLYLAGWIGDEVQDGERGNRLTTPRLSHHGEGFTLVQVEGHIVHGLDHAFLGVEIGLQAFDLEQFLAVRFHLRRSLSCADRGRPAARRPGG